LNYLKRGKMKRKQKQHDECDRCGERKADVELQEDPYNRDVNDRIVLMFLCDDCREERAADI
jgi:hypothetical protein